jgi:hypothetical protein
MTHPRIAFLCVYGASISVIKGDVVIVGFLKNVVIFLSRSIVTLLEIRLNRSASRAFASVALAIISTDFLVPFGYPFR